MLESSNARSTLNNLAAEEKKSIWGSDVPSGGNSIVGEFYPEQILSQTPQIYK